MTTCVEVNKPTWVKEDKRTWLQKLATNVLTQGPLPRHVGFILDGNRRYAKGKNLRSVDGHSKGFDRLTDTLRWCMDIGITELTAYVFSIENFKRPKVEVDGIMMLAKKQFEKLLLERENINKDGICIQIIGDWSFVPPELKQLMAKAMLMTRNNKRARLNVAFAYTARNEMARGVNSLLSGVTKGELQLEDLSEDLLEDTFQIHSPKPLDLLIRTSGETRLSDFLLWQSSETVLCFADVLWPEFTYWHLLGANFLYQTNSFSLARIKPENPKETSFADTADSEKRRMKFSDKVRNEKWTSLNSDITTKML